MTKIDETSVPEPAPASAGSQNASATSEPSQKPRTRRKLLLELHRKLLDLDLMETKELGRRSRAELELLFGDMYAGWDRGVVITQEKFGDGETRFSERPMTAMELAARYVAAEIGANIFEIANSAAFAPIITFSQIQVYLGPVFKDMGDTIERLTAALTAAREEGERAGIDKDMLKALRQITLMARTSGGVAGRDEALCAACEAAEAVIAKATSFLSPTPPEQGGE